MADQSQELLKREFVYFISDTVALLGGSEEIVSQIRSCQEKPFTSQLIEELRKYNGKCLDELRLRLNQIEVGSVSKSK